MVDVAEKRGLLKDLWKTNPVAAKRLQRHLKKRVSKSNSKSNKGAPVTLAAQHYQAGLLGSSLKDDDHEENDQLNDDTTPVEYIAPTVDAELEPFEDDLSMDTVDIFRDVLERFGELEQMAPVEESGGGNAPAMTLRQRMMEGDVSSSGGIKDDMYDLEEDKPTLTIKQMRKLMRPTVAQLKQSTRRPDLVDVWDTTAPDPYFLVYLKAYRNTVPTPSHWSHKRRYMQGKRGIEKPPFRLPPNIEATKISEIRRSLQEKEANKTLKQKQRDKMRPKMHKMHIDYQVLHDAFFKYATKPTLTGFGDVYYEGKEYEVKMRQFKPGTISERLKEALGMTGGGPPPWLINMQRYGPPPNYPSLRIPGLTAPLPSGGEYGYHAGGWGKPPVDEYGTPVYGNYETDEIVASTADKKLWGDIPDASSDEEEEEDDDEDADAEKEADEAGSQTPQASVVGTATPFLGGMSSIGGATSVTSGLVTPLSVDIRGSTPGATPTSSVGGRAPYTVLQQQKAPAQPSALFQSTTVYKMPSVGGTVTPYAPGGMVTPLATGGGTVTPLIAGTQTPADIISLNPAEIEQEGVFAADVIRSQLRQHEEAARKARSTARQVDLTEAPPSTADEKGFDSALTVKRGEGGTDGRMSTATVTTDGIRSAATVVGARSTGATPTVDKKKKKKTYKF